MFDDNDKRGQVLRATMALARDRRWSTIALAEIATEAKLSLAELREEFPTKIGILQGFLRHVDIALMRKVGETPPEGSPRDRLEDVVLTRLELLAPYKESLKRIAVYMRFHPADAAMLACSAGVSNSWMLAAAGISSSGHKGRARVAGLMSVMTAIFPVWLKDGPDNARTMAALDARLKRGERWLAMMDRMCCGWTRCGPRTEKPAPPPTATATPAAESGDPGPGFAPAPAT